MIWLTLLGCAELWSGAATQEGPELTLDTGTPELVVPVEAELMASAGRKDLSVSVDAVIAASWSGEGSLRAFWRGHALAPQPEEGAGSLEMGALSATCADDGYVSCTISGEIVFEHLGGGAVTTTPELRMEGAIDWPKVNKIEHAGLLGVWGEPKEP